MLKPMIDIPLASLRCPQRLYPDDPKRLTRSRRRSAVGETRKIAAILVSDVVGARKGPARG
jgi:class 3 adenylate cyclase